MGLLGLLSWASDAIDSQIAAVVAWTLAGFGTLFGDISAVNSLLGGLADAVHSILASLWTWLNQLWQWLYTHLIQKLQDLINRIHDFLKRIFGPIVKWIQQAIATYKQLWNTYVKPIYDFLQRLRRVLVLFRLLGFKWAAALDARIVALENAITTSFLGVLANLNRIADWINFIIDPTGIFAPGVWLGSIAQSVGAIIGVIFGQMNNPAATSPPGQYTTAAGYFDANAMYARIATRNQTGVLPEDLDAVNSLRASAAAMGYTP